MLFCAAWSNDSIRNTDELSGLAAWSNDSIRNTDELSGLAGWTCTCTPLSSYVALDKLIILSV